MTAECGWPSQTVIEARGIIRRLLRPAPLDDVEREAIECWLEEHRPSPETYSEVLRAIMDRGGE
jgi:hypothetical protein